MNLTYSRHAFALLIILRISSSLFAQSTSSTLERLQDPVFACWTSYEDVQNCTGCHLTPNIFRPNDFCRMSEMEEWLASDKHTIARIRVEPFVAGQTTQGLEELRNRVSRQQQVATKNLKRIDPSIDTSDVGLDKVPIDWIGPSNILSRMICDNMWGEGSIKTKSGYEKFRDNCLTCHGGYQTGRQGFEFNKINEVRLGIDCLTCHQHVLATWGTRTTDWVDKHSATNAENEWRPISPEKKEAAGLRNLVKTSDQANLCFDCHVGNLSDPNRRMFVTHDMYAAGHPPLPSIELEKFCKEMPQHWQTPSELYASLNGYKERDLYFQNNYPNLTTRSNPGDRVFWGTRKMLVGALVARQKSLQLLIDSEDQNHPPDYALFDCAACHHDLKTPSDRQDRSYPGAPGRPLQHEWPETLVNLAYRFKGGQGTSQGLEDAIREAFNATPFGNPDRVADAARNLSSFIKSQTTVVEEFPVGEQLARAILKILASTPSEKLLTYDSARQVVWAMQTVAAELKAKGSPLDQEIVIIVQRLGQPSVTGIESKIPYGRDQFIYPESLKADLKLRASFDSTRLKDQLDLISQKLAASTSAADSTVE